jgi:recombination protein RecT
MKKMGTEAPIVTKNSATAVSIVSDNREKIAAIVPKGTDIGRYVGVMQAEINRNPDLASCHPATLAGAMIHCARLGLEPGLMNKIHLVPFFNNRANVKECTVIVGYEGLIDLAMRSGTLSNIQSHLVYERDEFYAALGSEAKLTHRPHFFGDRGKLVGVYAIAFFKDGNTKFEVLSIDDVEKIRATSKSKSIWEKHFGEMARKTALRRLCKHLEKAATPELSQAIELENKAEAEAGQHVEQVLLDAGITYEAPPTKAETDQFEAMRDKTIQELMNSSEELIAKAFGGLALADVIAKLTDTKKCHEALIRLKGASK